MGSRPMIRLRTAFRQLQGKKVHVLGSGPDGVLPEPDEVLVCVNLSASQPVLKGREPAITVIDFEGVSPEGIEKAGRREFKTRLRDIQLGHLIVCQSNDSVGGEVDALGAQFESVTRLYNIQRNRLLRRAIGLKSVGFSPSSMPSTGVTAVALAVAASAASVRMSGFSLAQSPRKSIAEHFYEVDGNRALDVADKSSAIAQHQAVPRDHASADALIIAAIAASGFPITSAEPSMQVLCHNWGLEPPEWSRHKQRRVTKRPSFPQYARSLRWSLNALASRGLR